MCIMIEGDEQNGQIGIPNRLSVCTDNDGEHSSSTLAEARQYLGEHKRSTMNSGSLSCSGFTGLPCL